MPRAMERRSTRVLVAGGFLLSLLPACGRPRSGENPAPTNATPSASQPEDTASVAPGVRTPLHDAAFHGDVDAARALVTAGASLSARDERGKTPIQMTVVGTNMAVPVEGRRAVLELLLEAGASPNGLIGPVAHGGLGDPSSETRVAVVRELLDRGATDGSSALAEMLSTVSHDDIEIARLLLSRGADPTPALKNAVPRFPEAATFLLDHGAKAPSTDLVALADLRSLSKAQLDLGLRLIREGAPLDATDDQASTALHHAVEGWATDPEHRELARRLIEGGASLERKDAKGLTPLMVALQSGRPNWTAVETLVRAGSNPNVSDEDGRSPLQLVAYSAGPVALVQLLLANHAEVNHRDAQRRTALTDAAQGKSFPIVRLLLDHGADPNAADRYGQTPLRTAVGLPSLDVIQALVDSGADPTLADRHGATPLSLAERGQRPEVVKILLGARK
jgi:ankyrin repeat protein